MATDADHEEWFMAQSMERCTALFQLRTEKYVSADNEMRDYDSWLNFFKKVPVDELRRLANESRSYMNAEAYAALMRWVDIINSPQRIDKIYQAGLAKTKQDKKSISELAESNDKLGVLYAIRDEIAEKLDRGTGARDTAALAKEMANIMDLITEAERRQGPSKDTKLAELLSTTPPKRTRGKGARNTSYMSRTIKETEGA